jgi:hypothetical protein
MISFFFRYFQPTLMKQTIICVGINQAEEANALLGRLIAPDDSRRASYFFPVLSPIGSEDDLVAAFAAMVPALKQLHREATRR